MVVLWDKNLKEFVWKVVSDKMDKTRVVSITVVRVHPLYKKRYTVYKKCYAHDETNQSKLWDIIKIRQRKPMSKNKRWMLMNVVQKVA